METIEIKSQEEFEKYYREDKKLYFFDGNIKVNCSLNFKKPLVVNGFLYIEAGEHIKAGGSIKAGWYIEAGGSIKARWYIEAGGYIKAREYIEAGGYIFSFQFEISAIYIISKTLPFWRKFYAAMPPLKNLSKQILDENNCWDNLRNIPTKKEAQKICSWNGWHWIIRGQLECFFGLKDRFEPPND